MKLLYSFLFFNLLYLQNYAQNDSLFTNAEYNMRLNFEKTRTFKANLYFNNEKAAFIYNETQGDVENLNDEENIEINLVIKDTIKHKIYTIREKNILLEKQKNILTKENFYYAKENTPSIKWTITAKTKKIGEFNCNHAFTEFRGRSYEVWFTTQIPTTFGPWKFHGLPGLIVKVVDSNSEVEFLLKKVNYNIKHKIKTPSNKTICINQHINKEKELAINLKKRLESIATRGTTLNIEIKMTKIERNFNDINEAYKCNE